MSASRARWMFFAAGVVLAPALVTTSSGCEETPQGSGTNTNWLTIEGKDGSLFVPEWRDEFEGDAVDPGKWYVLEENPAMDLPYRRNWKAKNVSVEDGALVIRVVEEGDGSFSAGAVRTGSYDETPWLFSQTYGRYEVRVRLPAQQGHWAAFWLNTPAVFDGNQTGRDGTEIDVFEWAFRDDRVQHTVGWESVDGRQGDSFVATGFSLDDGDWHTFALEWYPDEYLFYIDGTESWRTSAGGVSQVPQYIKLSEEIGNYGVGHEAWGVGPISDARLPDAFEVDYVRVWRYAP